MGARRWVPAGAAVLLVVGVLATRGGTAAGEADLRPPVAAPSSGPTTEPPSSEQPALVLEANGVPGLRLGSAQRPGTGLVDLSQLPDADGDGRRTSADLPGGCDPTYLDGGETAPGYGTSGWAVDGVVSSVQVSRWDPGTGVLPGIETWLGPTLGSPVESASELPGARTTVERPHGPSGPAVTVVHVPLDGVEVVFSDATYDMTYTTSAASADDLAGRITTIEVRHPRARACSQEALDALGPLLWGPPVSSTLDLTVGGDGVAAFPLGTPVAAVADAEGFTEESAGQGCQAYSATTPDGGWVRLVALDGTVVQVQAYGAVPSALGVGYQDTEEQVRAAWPETWETSPKALPDTVLVPVAGREVRFDMYPGMAYVPDVDVPVQGGPKLVQGFSVQLPDVPSARLC